MVKLVVGIVVGVILSFFSVSLFTQFQPYYELSGFLGQSDEWFDILRWITIYIEYSFDYDFFSLILGNTELSVYSIFSPVLLSWIFVGVISGIIVNGIKRGVMASSISAIVFILIWILMGIIAGRDLMNLFQGINLLVTLGGILGALIGSILGGIIGGVISGPYEGSV